MKRIIVEKQEKFVECCRECDLVNSIYLGQLSKFKKSKEKMENIVEAKTAYENVLNVLNNSDNVNIHQENHNYGKMLIYSKIVKRVSEARSENSDKPKNENIEEKMKIHKRLKKVVKDLEKINTKILEYVIIFIIKSFSINCLMNKNFFLKN
jgi:hypothetical protein